MSKRFLVVYEYKGEEIRLVIEEEWNDNGLFSVSILHDKKYIPFSLSHESDIEFNIEDGNLVIKQPNRPLTREDIRRVILKKIELEEKKIDVRKKENHSEICEREIHIFTLSSSKILEFYVRCNYRDDNVWYYVKDGNSDYKKTSFDDAPVVIGDEIERAKSRVGVSEDKSLLWQLKNLREIIREKSKQKSLRRMCPELF